MNALKEPAISQIFVGLTEDWEKIKGKTASAVNKVLFFNKY